MGQYSSVNEAAWRACGVSLALVHGGRALAHLDYDTLTTLFRSGVSHMRLLHSWMHDALYSVHAEKGVMALPSDGMGSSSAANMLDA